MYALPDSLKMALVKDSIDKLPGMLNDQQASEMLHALMTLNPDLHSVELLDRKA